MPEQIKTPEKVTREQAIEAYKKFVERGITSPDDLDLSDPEVIEANRLFEEWAKPDTNEGDSDRHNFEKTKFYVDAGFTDSKYLSNVLGWLFQDSGDILKQPDNLERTQLRGDYIQAMTKIRNLIKESGGR